MLTFNDMPLHSRAWVYQSDRVITDLEVNEIRRKAAMFLMEWTSHGNVMRATIDVLYNRFLVVLVDEKEASASGCGIDKSVKFMQQLESDYSLNLFDRMLVLYRNPDSVIQTTKLYTFEQMMEKGELTADTIVFNNLISTKADMQTMWEVPVKKSWHARMIPA
ncbi:MAG TPA: ABC transporter ATPase [Bacteroidia bacterium]|nr:ABC transporter ATPase [Bacteroidia bacterium]